MNVFEINTEEIKATLKDLISQLIDKKGQGLILIKGSFKLVYFAGRTLFFDIKGDSITLCHSDESFGLFSGGVRRLMDIETVTLMEKLMVLCEINHDKKWITN